MGDREIRANNPLGVSKSKTIPFDGIDTTRGIGQKNLFAGTVEFGIDNELGDELLIFRTMQDGANAGARLLNSVYFDPPFDSPLTIGDHWAGDTEKKAQLEKRMSYGRSISEIMHLPGNSLLIFSRDGVDLMEAISRMENGNALAVSIDPSIWPVAVVYGLQPFEVIPNETV
jgi:hypothetical protein